MCPDDLHLPRPLVGNAWKANLPSRSLVNYQLTLSQRIKQGSRSGFSVFQGRKQDNDFRPWKEKHLSALNIAPQDIEKFSRRHHTFPGQTSSWNVVHIKMFWFSDACRSRDGCAVLIVERLDVPFALSISSENPNQSHAGCAPGSFKSSPLSWWCTEKDANASASLAHANEPADSLKAACDH